MTTYSTPILEDFIKEWLPLAYAQEAMGLEAEGRGDGETVRDDRLSTRLQLLLEGALESALNGVKVLVGGGVVLALRLAGSQGKILGHDTVDIDSVNTGLLEALSKGNNVGGIVKLATLDKTTSPGEDGGDRVGGGLVTLLVLTVVASDSTVGSLRLEGLAIGGDENGCHEAKRAEALGDNVRLDITVIVCE